MKIDCHTHLFPKSYLKELRRLNLPFEQRLDERFTEPEKRVEDMEIADIDRQVVSLAVPGVDVASPETSVQLSRVVNDELSRVASDDERFIGLASLPMLSPMKAVEELERAVNELGLKGAGIFTSVAGKPIDGREFWPVYERASSMGVPLFIHPIAPLHGEVYTDYNLLAVLGFPFETTHAVTRLVLSGVLEEFPGLVLVLSHLGGTLPYLVGRIDDGHRVFKSPQSRITKPPSEYLKEMYLDGASFYLPALRCALDFWGPEKILVGSDYPYGWVGNLSRCIEIIEQLPLEEEESAMIYEGNATKVLRLDNL
jgi:aminocarboxymuconate-semialdehyde decarboxylase